MKLNLANQSIGITILYTVVLASIFSTPVALAGDNVSFSVGAFGGFATSMTGEAVDGYQDSEWSTGSAFGGSIIYRRANGLMFELLIEQFEMGLEENGDEFGTLKATPILLMVGYQGLPKNQTGLAFHATIGGGVASSDFEKGDFVKDLENTNGGNIDISNDSAFMFEVGGGMDYFFTKNIAVVLDGRFLIGSIDSKWEYTNGNREDFKLQASNFQGLVGVRFWF